MKTRFPMALFLAGILVSSTVQAMAAPVQLPITSDRRDDPPRPRPTPGPRDP